MMKNMSVDLKLEIKFSLIEKIIRLSNVKLNKRKKYIMGQI